MSAVIAVAGFVLLGSALWGSAIWQLCTGGPGGCATPAVGFGALLVVATVAVQLPGHAVLAVVLIGLGTAAAAAHQIDRLRHPPVWAGAAGAATLVLSLLPFAAAGHAGVLGVGTNDDMGEHLLGAWALQHHALSGTSKLVASGYPIGPHALAAGIAQATGFSLEHVFMGIIVAVPALLALAAGALLPGVRPAWRLGAAIAVGLCYLQAAYLVQASFKEPMQALFLVAFTAALSELRRDRARRPLRAIPPAAIAAASTYVYSYTSLLWLGGTALLLFLTLGLLRRRAGLETSPPPAFALRELIVAGGAFAALVAPEVTRMVDFTSSSYNHEGATVLGDLLRPLSPLEATGIWPRLDFRFPVSAGSLGGVLGIAALPGLLACLIAALRRREFEVPAALITALVLYGLMTTRSPYSAAKALVITAPLATLVLGRELTRLAGSRQPWQVAARLGLSGLLAVAAFSSLEVLRDGPVGPTAHALELSALQTRIGRQPTLFLGTDDLVHWELRGANLATPPAPLYTTAVVPLRADKSWLGAQDSLVSSQAVTTNRLRSVGLAYDFDSVPSRTLDRFSYVIVPRSSYASLPPPNWHPAGSTRSYELWRRSGPTPAHSTLAEVDNPGAVLDCHTAPGRALAAQPGVAMVRPAPVVGERSEWRGHVGYAGQRAFQELRLGAGRWDVSLQYDSSTPVTLLGPGLRASLPPSLEPLGPYWYAGTLHVRRSGMVRIVIAPARLPLIGRLTGAFGLTRAPAPTGLRPLGRIAATPAPAREYAVPLARACGRYVDWYRLSPAAG